MIPYGRQEITQADIDAVVAVLRSDFLTQGPMVAALRAGGGQLLRRGACRGGEQRDLGLAHRLPGAGSWSGRLAMDQPDHLRRLGQLCDCIAGRESISSISIPQAYNLCPKALERKLIDGREGGAIAEGRRARASVRPALRHGRPSLRSRGKYGFRIIEDASHAIGGSYRGSPSASCRYSDISVFSFHPVKIITTGEGGMALTQDAKLAERMALLRSHGVTRDAALMTKEPDGPWYYQQIDLGFNYRMTELQAALGLSQMARLEDYVARRHEIARRYDEMLARMPLEILWRNSENRSALHLYVVRLKDGGIHRHRQAFDALRARGVGVNLHYIPVHTQPYYRNMGFKDGDFPNAEAYYEGAISLPMYATLKEEDQDRVINALESAFAGSAA